MEDQSKFFNVIIDKTNQKLNSFQAQIIVLESQLQMANDERDAYKKYADGNAGSNLSAADLENIKIEFLNMQSQLKKAQEENINLKNQVTNFESSINNSTKFVRDQNETLLQEIKRLNAELATRRSK
jgi:predicted  nucleic acid-binding Zn-ribbon protein